MTTSNALQFGGECEAIFKNAYECLNYLYNRYSDSNNRANIGPFLSECAAYNDLKSTFIDSETGKFFTVDVLSTVIDSLKNMATNAFGSRFPLLQWKTLDLVWRMQQAGAHACLHESISENVSIH